MQKSILCTVIIRAVALFGVFQRGSPYPLAVRAYAAEKCFSNVVDVGTELVLTYEASDGGFLDIGVKIVDPDGVLIYERSKESDGKHTFDAAENGSYAYCFNNRMSMMKSISFNMVITASAAHGININNTQIGEEDDHKKLANVLQELGFTLINIKHEQMCMNVRDKNHRAINESTNWRVVIWSFFELFVLLLTAISQVYYLKRFFKIRQIV